MRRFSFSLEKVLEVRKIRTRLAEEKLATRLRDRDRTLRALEGERAVRQSAMNDIRSAMQGPIRGDSLVAMFRFLSSVEQAVKSREQELCKQESRVAEAREEVVVRTREEEALERLRRRRLESYMDAYWWEQGKLLDEVAAQRFIRNERR